MNRAKKFLQFMLLLWNDERGILDIGGGGDNSGSADGGSGTDSNGSDGSGGETSGKDSGGSESDSSSSNESDGKIDYPADLDENLRDNPTLMNFLNKETKSFNHGAIMKAFVNAKSMIGADKIALPGDGASDEELRGVLSKIGLPAELDKYKLENKAEEGISLDAEMFKDFTKMSFDAGVLPGQAQKIVDFYNTRISKEVKTANDKSTSDAQTALDGLKTDWGTDFDYNKGVAEAAITQFATGDLLKKIDSSGLGKDPDFARLMLAVGKGLDEDTFDEGLKKNLGMSELEITKEVKEIWESKAFRNKLDPGYKASKDRYMQLMKMKTKGK